MQDLFKRWEFFAKEDEEKNFFFVRGMKFQDENKVDRIAKRTHREVFEQINCLECGNCCRTLATGFTDEDVKRISAHVKMTEEEFRTQYLEHDEWGGTVTKSLPCPMATQPTP
jgi:hypothetical protein